VCKALCQHRAPDYKVHFSVIPDHVPRAFNLIGKHFFKRKCPFGMKAIMIDKETECENMQEDMKWNTGGGSEKSFTLAWPEKMKGREITFYIYRYYELDKFSTIREFSHGDFTHHSIHDTDGKYHKSNFMEYYSSTHPFQQFELKKSDEQPLSSIKQFVREVEEILEQEGITPNGCADGDLPLGGKYASFRNETFIPCMDIQEEEDTVITNVNDLFCYPPNDAGWNAAGFEEANDVYESLRLDKINGVYWYLPLVAILVAVMVDVVWNFK